MDFSDTFQSTFGDALKLLQDPFLVADSFCHYTNLQGLIGIIESNEIWLSDHRFLNDELEYSYGKELALSVILEMTSSEEDNNVKAFLNSLHESIKKPSSHGIYVGSMSLSPDKLDQWKGYGNSNESICIKFRGDSTSWNMGNSHPTHLRQQKVIYDETQQRELIRNIVHMYREQFHKFSQFAFPLLQELTFLIESQFIIFKHPEYASEDELRLTIANLDHILRSKKPKHRINKGMVIPYITTKYISTDANPKTGGLPINEIIVSPTSKPDLLESVKVFVANMGYVDVHVVSSSIKFRG